MFYIYGNPTQFDFFGTSSEGLGWASEGLEGFKKFSFASEEEAEDFVKSADPKFGTLRVGRYCTP